MRRTTLTNLSIATLATSLALSACSSPPENEHTHTTPATTPAAMEMGSQDMSAREDMGSDDPDEEMGAAKDMERGTEDMSADMSEEPDHLEIPPGPWDITQKGPFNVGYTTTTVTYQIAPSMEDRTLDVVIWYPTRVKLARRAGYFNGFLKRDNLTFEEPLISDTPQTFPVLLFSHGNGSIAEQSYFQSEHFASHGWVVVAPYHTNNTLTDNPSAINYGSAVERPQDISALIDWLEVLPEDNILHGRLELDKIAMSGHSFGAFTTMAMVGAQFAVDELLAECESMEVDGNYASTCDLFNEDSIALFREGFYEPRIKVAVPHTPGIQYVFRDGIKEVKTPTLIMTGSRDRALPNEENGDPMYALMEGDHARFDLPNGGHFTYSNMCQLLGAVEQAANDGCNDTFIDDEIALPMINHYTMAWIHYHVLGETQHEALVRGEVRPYDAEIMTYESKK